MKILFLTTHFNTGGITSYLLTLAKGLISLNHEVYVVSCGGNMVGPLTSMGAKHLQIDIKTKSELSPKIYLNLKFLSQFIVKEKIDVIHAQTRVTQVLANFLYLLTKRPFLSTCHGFFKKRISRILFPCWGRKVIAISPAVYGHLVRDFKMPKEKVELIINGIDLEDFSPVNEDVKKYKKEKYGLKDSLTIGIIARLSDVKGHDILLSAMPEIIREIPTIKLLIVGEGKTESILRKLVEDLDLSKHVLFYPIVDQTAQMLSLFDLFVLPSLQEGLGLSVLEAQAMALPVIASRVGGIPNIIEDGKTGILVSPKEPKELASAILRVFRNYAQAKHMGQQARVFIEKKFSAETMVEQTVNLYKKL